MIDLFIRHMVAWSLREDMTRDIVIDALRMAWFNIETAVDSPQSFAKAAMAR